MKVIAIDCSPPFDSNRTILILGPFIAGIKDQGASIEMFFLKDLRLALSEGDMSPWLKKKGKRARKDDLEILRPRLEEADLWVFTTPVYCDGMCAQMKNLLDRMTALTPPFLEVGDGRSPKQAQQTKPKKFVLIATSTAWELDTFAPLLAHVKAYCANTSREFVGALFRPHSAALTWMLDRGLPAADVFEAAYQAGCETVKSALIAEATSETVSRQLVQLDLYVDLFNQRMRQRMDYPAPKARRR